jgi:hypothetical protein
MAKLIFRAEIPLPRQIILPLVVANAAQSQRTIVLADRQPEVHEAIAKHLQTRHPRWFEAAPDLASMTVKQLKEYAAEKRIDLGKAERKDDILKVIAGASKAKEPEDDPGADASQGQSESAPETDDTETSETEGNEASDDAAEDDSSDGDADAS